MNNLFELHQEIEKLLSSCYEKYKHLFSSAEKEVCEMYIYQQGEYGEALSNLEAILTNHRIELDIDSVNNIEKAKRLMKI